MARRRPKTRSTGFRRAERDTEEQPEKKAEESKPAAKKTTAKEK